MASKRKQSASTVTEEEPTKPLKKAKKGFTVGPENLPHGPYRRKVQKIKRGLIHNAKIKKEYAKIRERQEPEPTVPTKNEQNAASLELHPERQAMLDAPGNQENKRPKNFSQQQRRKHLPRRKRDPFEKESRFAQKQKEEAEARHKAIEEAQQRRQQKLEERERFRRAMAKARSGGQNGQRKLGRESKILLEKVKNLVAK